jgi:cobalt-zinc-cadmium efflux system outer membrane protein
MRRGGWRGALVAALPLLASTGCASVPRDAGFGDVKRLVEERTGQQVDWDPGEEITASSDERVREWLAGELTADRAVQAALANNRDLRAELEQLGIARADLVAASTIRNPVLDGEIRSPGEPHNPFELILTQSLIDLLQLGARRAAGRATFEAARREVAGAVVAFTAEVRTDYYSLQAAQQLLARQQTVTEAARLSADIAGRQHQAGNISDLDLEADQARYEQAKLDLAAAQLAEIQTRVRLGTDLGLVANPPSLMLPAQLPPIPAAEQEPQVGDVEARLASRLDVGLVQAQIDAARSSLRLARGAGFDELAAGVHREREPEGEVTTGPALALPLPIFNNGRAERLRAVATLRQGEQRLEAIRVNARAEIAAAQERLREARARTEYLRDVVVPRRLRILHLTHLEYNAMLRGVFQVIQARQDLDEAERGLVLAQRDYWLARTDLDTALSGASAFAVERRIPLLARPELAREPGRQQQAMENP